jgi:putative peptidoglycan lipid II flippase
MLILIQRRPWRDGIATPIRISFDPQIRGFLRKGIPGMVANAGPQFLIVGGAIIASSSPAAVSWLYFANRLIELPLGMVGVAMGTVLVPELTRAIRSDDRDALMQAESRGAELATALVLPAALGLILLSQPIIRVLFERGAFTPADTIATAQALSILALGLPAHVLVKALSPDFRARRHQDAAGSNHIGRHRRGDLRLVVRPLLWRKRRCRQHLAGCMVLRRNSDVARQHHLWLLHRRHGAAAVATDRDLRRRDGRDAFLAESFVAPVTATAGFMAQITILGGLVAAGVSFYGLLLDLSGVLNWGEAISNLRDGRLRD